MRGMLGVAVEVFRLGSKSLGRESSDRGKSAYGRSKS